MKDSFQDHMDNLFRNMLQFHKKEPGKHVWKNIEKELDRDDEAALLTQRKERLKKTVALLLLMVILTSTLFYYLTNPDQSRLSIAPVDKKSGTGIQSPMKTFPITPVSIGSNSIVHPDSLQGGNIEIKDPDFRYSNMNYSVTSVDPDFNQSYSADLVFHPLNLQEEKPSILQTSANYPVIQLQQPFQDRFSVTPYFSQEFAGYNFTDNDITAPNGKEVEKAERNVFSASVGMYLNFKINKKWVLQSGLSYSWSNSIMDSSQSYAEKNSAGDIAFKLNTASGFSFLRSPTFIVPVVGDSMATANTHSELHYITVPLVLSYRVGMRRFSLLAGAGMTFNVLTHAALETDIYGANYKGNESEIPLKGLKKINFGMLVKAEIQYRVNKKMAISLIPSFKNTLGPINMRNSSLAAYPYNFGIGTGIIYLF
jgi:outer membrane scaffolding protein for murein synthesis (MipA/OmpV family)